MEKLHISSTTSPRFLTFLIIVSIMLCSATGCSSQKNCLTSNDSPDLRCDKLETFSNDSKFWSWAYENVPTVTSENISSGAYDNTYVCRDYWVIGCVDHNDWAEMHLIAETSENEYARVLYTPGIDSLSTPKYGKETISNVERNDKLKFCFFVENGHFLLDHSVGIKNLGNDSSFDVEGFLKKEKIEKETTAKAENIPSNPLLKSTIKTGTIYSGDNSKIIGSYGYINLTKSELKSITQDDFIEFAAQKVDGNHLYNWISLICEDGTGITFAGCNIYTPIYGKQDSDGSILEEYGNISWDFDSEEYSYSAD